MEVEYEQLDAKAREQKNAVICFGTYDELVSHIREGNGSGFDVSLTESVKESRKKLGGARRFRNGSSSSESANNVAMVDSSDADDSSGEAWIVGIDEEVFNEMKDELVNTCFCEEFESLFKVVVGVERDDLDVAIVADTPARRLRKLWDDNVLLIGVGDDCFEEMFEANILQNLATNTLLASVQALVATQGVYVPDEGGAIFWPCGYVESLGKGILQYTGLVGAVSGATRVALAPNKDFQGTFFLPGYSPIFTKVQKLARNIMKCKG